MIAVDIYIFLKRGDESVYSSTQRLSDFTQDIFYKSKERQLFPLSLQNTMKFRRHKSDFQKKMFVFFASGDELTERKKKKSKQKQTLTFAFIH